MRLKLLFLVFSFFTVKIVFSQNINLYNQFSGKIDFTMIGNTLNTQENGTTADCSITTSSSASLNLDANDTIESAYLYWSGSGSGDFEVTLNNQLINADCGLLKILKCKKD